MTGSSGTASVGTFDGRDSATPSLADAPGSLAWLREQSGDRRLRPWRLTPELLEAYLGGVRAMVRGGPAVEAADPGAVLDVDRQPTLRPWALGRTPPEAEGVDVVREIARELAARPALATCIREHVPLDTFAAAHVKLAVCVRALLLLAGGEADTVTAAQVENWAAAQRPGPGGEADFAASLVTAVAGRAAIDAAFAGR